MTALKNWLFARDTRQNPGVMTAVRIGLGLMWISNLSWKVPPQFGQGSSGGLYASVNDAVAHPVFPPYSWLIEHAVIPQFLLFAWVTLAVETLLAVLLLTGTLTRFAAVLGIAQSLAIGLSVAAAPNEWPWSYLLMVLGHLAILGSLPGRQPGVDRVLAAGRDRSALAGRQLMGWAGVALLAGLWATAASLGDPLASNGTTVGISVLQLQVGQFNLLGGVMLLLLGATLAFAARRRSARAAQAAAVVALLAAVSVVSRWGFGSVPLGGNGSSTALFLALALVGALMGSALIHPGPAADQDTDINDQPEPAPAAH